MEEAEVLKSVVGLALGAIGTYLGLHWKIRKELVAQYDQELRKERVRVYLELWALTEPLATYSPPGKVTTQTLKALSRDLRHWYFASGGLFLSENARDAYFALQKSILLNDADHSQLNGTELSIPAQKALRKVASRLRTALTADIGSRFKPAIKDESDA